MYFIPVMQDAMQSAKLSGFPIKVIRSGDGWKAISNLMPRGPWERFWHEMSRAAQTDTCSAVFAEQFPALVNARNPSALAAALEVGDLLSGAAVTFHNVVTDPK